MSVTLTVVPSPRCMAAPLAHIHKGNIHYQTIAERDRRDRKVDR